MARLKITQTKSRIGATAQQKKNLDALGLRKMNATVTKVKQLVKVEEVK